MRESEQDQNFAEDIQTYQKRQREVTKFNKNIVLECEISLNFVKFPEYEEWKWVE